MDFIPEYTDLFYGRVLDFLDGFYEPFKIESEWPENPDDRGMILSDNTEGEKLRKLIRKMRHFNTIPNIQQFYAGGYRNIKLEYIIEDPIFRDSQHSFIHQMNDVIAYCVRQKYEPNNYMKKKGGHNFYKRLNNVTTRAVSRSNDLGIVEI